MEHERSCRPPAARYDAVVVGVSAGGLNALRTILPALPADFPAAVIVCQHLGPQADDFIARFLDEISAIHVKEAEEKEPILPGVVYFAPPNYHLLVEEDRTLSLSCEARVCFARPSIDVLFETAAEAYGRRLAGVILTGANNDGSRGLQLIAESGGLAIVQDPDTAEATQMPSAAIELVPPAHVYPLEAIAPVLIHAVYGDPLEAGLPECSLPDTSA